ncbi:MAG: 4Fe-4S double cluster binding domain-containing protein [Candidatus Kariarchaeaceae archaeon]|jgi:epoxyqueuosine reductase QueG
MEVFSNTYSERDCTPEDLTIISWVLPQTEETKVEHRVQTKFPTERWARARIFGEEVNNKLRKHVVAFLIDEGYEAEAPLLSSLYDYHSSERYDRASSWSERHTAYASGLGTFGLCDGLITPKGKAIRCGSVITRMKIPPTPRPYSDHQAYCLFFAKGTCGKCIKRCPNGAISKERGHNKQKCSEHLDVTRKFVEETFDFEGYGCGLCQTAVPCESRIPKESI